MTQEKIIPPADLTADEIAAVSGGSGFLGSGTRQDNGGGTLGSGT